MTEGASTRRPIEQILDLARWAPSGDNEQCWRFQIVDDEHVVVHGYDTRDHCVYDLDGSASQIGIGALVETLAIAASAFGLRVDMRRLDGPIEEPLIDIRLTHDAAVLKDPLFDEITKRTVQRRALSTRALTDDERRALSEVTGTMHEVVWLEGPAARRRMAGLLFASAKLRLIMPEAYRVHREAIAWGARFSDDRVPEAAVGLDPMTAVLMRWVMRSWTRVSFFNRYLAGTWMPRIQLDLVPALRCAAHFVLVAGHPPRTIDDFIAAGRAVQRFWLTASRLKLQLQPEVTPLIFSRYSRDGLTFSSHPKAGAMAQRTASGLDEAIGPQRAAHAVFMGRVGAGPAAISRSLRMPLQQLMFDRDAFTRQKVRRTST